MSEIKAAHRSDGRTKRGRGGLSGFVGFWREVERAPLLAAALERALRVEAEAKAAPQAAPQAAPARRMDRVRGGRDRGTPNGKTRQEILDPYDELRRAGFDDIRARAKVADSLVPMKNPTKEDWRNARKRVSKMLARYRGKRRGHKE